MMKCLLFLLALTSAFNQIHAEMETPPEIRVHLATATTLSPIYVGKTQTKNAVFDPSYIHQLEKVLAFDLNHNSSTKVAGYSSAIEQLLASKDNQTAFHATSWKNAGIAYALRLQLNARALIATVFNAHEGSIKTFPEIALTGNLAHDRRQIHKLADGIHKALFHTDGIASQKILFAYQVKNPRSDGTEWISEIWECDWDGANPRQLTHDNSYSVTPVALPHHPRYNNDSFLYVSYKLGQPKIYIGSLKGGVGKRLIDLRGNQLLPAISQQRDKIAFICDAGGRTDLFLQPLNPANGEVGKPVQLFSYPRSTQASPTFSPDGSQIAFVSDKDGGMRIYIIPATVLQKRAHAVMISKRNRQNSCPCWSPDGTKLAYSAKTNGIRQIWIYDFATEEETQVTSGPGNKENPCWASNSRHIVFNSVQDSTSELYIANLNQPEAIKISNGPGKKHYPTWGR